MTFGVGITGPVQFYQLRRRSWWHFVIRSSKTVTRDWAKIQSIYALSFVSVRHFGARRDSLNSMSRWNDEAIIFRQSGYAAETAECMMYHSPRTNRVCVSVRLSVCPAVTRPWRPDTATDWCFRKLASPFRSASTVTTNATTSYDVPCNNSWTGVRMWWLYVHPTFICVGQCTQFV